MIQVILIVCNFVALTNNFTIMKKILFLLAMLPMMCFGQDNLKVVDMIVEGTRIIRISPSDVFNFTHFTLRSVYKEGHSVTIYPVISKTFSAYGKSNQRITYDLQIKTVSPMPISIAKNARILLKKKDGSNIMLRTISNDEDHIGSRGNLYGDEYNIIAFFGVTLAQLKAIADGDISKMRIEYTGAIKNIESENNKFSTFVKQAIVKIEEAEKIKDAFLEGF